MQNLKYTTGHWQADARFEELEPENLMAITSVIDKHGGAQPDSRHTIVFEHHPCQDKLKETEMPVQRLLHEHYGA